VQIGDFRIQERLGAGGMGIVYRALQISLNRPVALKVLGSALSRKEDLLRFQREAQAAARLKHPGIASVYFIGQDHQLCYMVMELIEGLSLRQVLEGLKHLRHPGTGPDALVSERGTGEEPAPTVRFDDPTGAPIPREAAGPGEESLTGASRKLRSSAGYIGRCCEIVRDAARALHHAHQNGVVHRDIKPENLILGEDGQVHIIDFGIARFFEDAELTGSGQLVGTPLYMSPEQVSGRVQVTHLSDIYSLGLVLYELLTLRPPFRAPNREALLRQVVTKATPPITWRNRAIPRDLENIVHKATGKDPDERYGSAEELADDLDRYLKGKPVLAHPFRYRFDRGEIVAARPGSLMAAAFPFFLLATVLMLGILMPLFGLIILHERQDPGKYWHFLMYSATSAALAAGSFLVGKGLLGGQGWARWTASGIALAVMAWAAFIIQVILRGSGEPPPHGLPANVDETVYLKSQFLALVPLALAIASSAGVLILLFLSSTRRWFRFARQIRLEHRRLRAGED